MLPLLGRQCPEESKQYFFFFSFLCFVLFLFVLNRKIALAPVCRLDWNREILKAGLVLGSFRTVLL